MTLLLDTHLLLWAASGAAELPATAKDMINDPANEVAFSAANLWEIAIKRLLARSDLKVNPHILRTRLVENGYAALAISSDHALAVVNLPDHNIDPFDRILVAQAQVEGFTLLTADEVVASYPGPIMKV
jgi:PIN domain nuclease of toxin-antitoxin system